MSSRELCPGPGRSSLEVVDGGQLPDGGFSLRRPYIHISETSSGRDYEPLLPVFYFLPRYLPIRSGFSRP